ncbi:Hypothetical Protein RSKD131_1558 [Cereibacter sphaeroides KD131]|nr:Hypothetical Protein RSKD131_1558 [Cereibacter sphaeroides KD131]
MTPWIPRSPRRSEDADISITDAPPPAGRCRHPLPRPSDRSA